MRLYLAGPMTGLPDHNFPAFHDMAGALRMLGHDVVNPAELDDGDTSKPWEHYMRRDLAALVTCEAVAVLPGWQQSRGATLEVHVARALGMPVLDADTLQPYRESVLEEAQRLVHGDRGASYGHPIDDYDCTGRIWAAILDRWLRSHPGFEDIPRLPDIDPRIAALMMVGVKVSREAHKPKRDNRTDMAGYAECVDMVHAEQARRAHTP